MKTLKILKGLVILGAILASGAAISCSRGVGYGVVLWSPDEVAVSTGLVVKIESRIASRSMYLIAPLNTKSAEVIELEQWRVRSFKRRASAETFAKAFAPYTRSYAEGLRRGLPIREQPQGTAPTVSKIREGETVKIISRGKAREQIGSYKAYWYEALAGDGSTGYVYGRFLREYLISDDGKSLDKGEDYLGDDVLEKFFDPEVKWRPAYFADMIKNGKIDLSQFRGDYGLVIDPRRKSIRIGLPNRTVNYTYIRIMPLGRGAYYFDGTGFGLRLTENVATANYSYMGQNFQDDFIPIEGDLDSYKSAEVDRRSRAYRNLLQEGPKFISDWGILEFTGNNRFSLTSADRFKENGFLSDDDGMAGTVSFDVLLDGVLAEKFDGVMTLTFDQSGARMYLIYAASVGDRGLRVIAVDDVPRNNVMKDEALLENGADVTFTGQ